MGMTVGELMEELEQYGSDVEVRLATQPHYPLASTVRAVEATEADEDDEHVVWIVEGSQCRHPYAPRELFG